MQLFVRHHHPVIAAAIEGDVDGIPKGSHYVRLPADGVRSKQATAASNDQQRLPQPARGNGLLEFRLEASGHRRVRLNCIDRALTRVEMDLDLSPV